MINKKRIGLGFFIILLATFYAFGKYLPDNYQYIINYQVLLIISGIIYRFTNSSKLGYFVSGIGVYLYIKEFFGHIPLDLFIILMFLLGIYYIYTGFKTKDEANGKAFFHFYKDKKSKRDNKDFTDAEEVDSK